MAQNDNGLYRVLSPVAIAVVFMLVYALALKTQETNQRVDADIAALNRRIIALEDGRK